MKILISFLIYLLIVGCEYIPRETYKIKTIDGHIIKLSCPVIDQDRNKFTYMIDGDCIIIK